MLKLTLTAGLCLIFTSLDFSCNGKPTTTTVPANFCVGKKDGHYAASSSANHYYSCVNEEGYYRPCPANLIFKENLQICDWPTATSHVVTMKSTTYKPNPTVPANFCVGKKDGHYAASSSANHYYSCVNEEGYYRPCPANLIFKENLQICDWPTATSHVVTMKSTTYKPNPTVPANFCVGKKDGHYAASSSANHYYSCVNEEGYYRPCPANLIFKENLQICDWPTATSHVVTMKSTTYKPNPTVPANFCVGKKDGHYAASSSANHYYSCVNEEGYYRPCPANLIFKENLQICDWPTATSPVVTIKSTTYKPNPTVPANFCVGKKDGHYAASSSANHYYSCVNEEGYYRPCPANLIFKENLQICDWPTATSPVVTIKSTTYKPNPTVPANFCVGKKDGHYAASSSANHYYSCVNEVGYYRPCPANLIFNEMLLICDWPTATPNPIKPKKLTQILKF